MFDIMYVVVAVVFFASCIWMANALERLKEK
jgi:hypothetical protein